MSTVVMLLTGVFVPIAIVWGIWQADQPRIIEDDEEMDGAGWL